MSGTPAGFFEHFPVSSSVLKRALFWLLSPQISFAFALHINGIIHYVLGGVCLISLTTTSVRFIYAAACNGSSLFFHCAFSFQSMHIPQFLYLSCSWWTSGLFPSLFLLESVEVGNILSNFSNLPKNSSLILIKLSTFSCICNHIASVVYASIFTSNSTYYTFTVFLAHLCQRLVNFNSKLRDVKNPRISLDFVRQ